MFTSIDEILGNVEIRNFILVLDNTVGRAGFLNHHFIGYGIKKRTKVVALGLDQTFGHYQSVASKLGINLIKSRENGSFHHIDGSVQILNSALGLESLLRVEEGLSKLHDEISSHLETGTVLVLDNISILSLLGFSDRELNTFLQKLIKTTTNLGGSLVCTISSNISHLEICNYLIRISDLCLVVEDLKTGKSRDVSGHLTIKSRSDSGGHQNGYYQFRLEERGIKVFSPGTSAAVL